MSIEDAYGNPKVSSSNDVAFEKEPRHGAKHGVHSTQPEGRKGLPPVLEVKTAECNPGTAKRQALKQFEKTGIN